MDNAADLQPDDEGAVDLHHDAALRQDVTLLAGVHDVALLQNFEGKRSVGFVLQLHLERLFLWVSGGSKS